MKRLREIFSGIFQPAVHAAGTSSSIELNILMAQISGLPLLGLMSQSPIVKIIVFIHGILTLGLITFLYPWFEAYDLILSWPNFSDIAQNTCLSLTHAAGVYKVANTFYRLGDIRKIVEKFKYITRNYIKTPKQREAYLRDDFRNKIFFLVYASLVGTTGLLGIFMLHYDPQTFDGKFFPYHVYIPVWFPHRIRRTYMGIAVLFLALQIVCVDYLNVSFMNQIRFHFNSINLALEDLISPEEDVNTKPRQDPSGKTIEENKALESVVQHHSYLKGIRDDVEDIFRVPLLLQFGISLFIYALTGFQATVGSDSAKVALLIYFYCCCIFMELFLYCYFGNEVIELNKGLADKGFGVSWYKYDRRFKKSLLIFITNAQRPVLFTAGGFMHLSLPSFAGILSKAYTYIAVLRQMYGD